MNALDDLRSAVCSDGAPSARNLLVTVFGDAIAPRSLGVGASVGSLTTLLDSFGVSERLVRTSLTRLVNEGLLAVAAVGRRSYYRVAEYSHEMFITADRKIYGTLFGEWDQRWTVVLIDGLDATAEVRAELRSQLIDRGFGVAAPNVLASAYATPHDIADLLDDDEVGRVLVLRAAVSDLPGGVDSVELAAKVYQLRELRDAYSEFIDRFAQYRVESVANLEPELAFKLRVLLVASYRRVVLDDPGLATDLLPKRWSGTRAREIVAELYAACFDAAEMFLEQTLVTNRRALPPTTVGADRFVVAR